MIYLLCGPNTYLREQALDEIIGDTVPERIDGEVLETRDLPDLLAGQTLFSTQRMIIIRGLSENSTVWAEATNYLDTVPDTTTVVVVEAKPDKRSPTYKLLQEVATVREFTLPRNANDAVRFTSDEAKRRGMKLEPKLVRQIVERVGLDPWDSVHALEKLSVLDTIDTAAIEQTIEASPAEQVFGLFEASLRGDTTRVHQMCETLAFSEDPYRVMGLLATQVMQLVALVTSDIAASVAVDLELKSDYGLSKLRPFAKSMPRGHVRKIVEAFGDADAQMKSSGEDPWALIEQALQKIATIK